MFRGALARQRPLILAAGMMTLLCVALFGARLWATGVHRYMFIPGNILLLWAPLVVGTFLLQSLKGRSWFAARNLLLTALWLFLLPNTWYVLTDFIHLSSTGEISEYFDIVMLTSLVAAGFLVGFMTLFEIHQELIKRLKERSALLVVMGILLLSSFAIYLGRNLRWNSWDIFANPHEIVLDVSDRIIDPLAHPKALNMTGLFFALLSTLYYSIWMVANQFNSKNQG